MTSPRGEDAGVRCPGEDWGVVVRWEMGCCWIIRFEERPVKRIPALGSNPKTRARGHSLRHPNAHGRAERVVERPPLHVIVVELTPGTDPSVRVGQPARGVEARIRAALH